MLNGLELVQGTVQVTEVSDFHGKFQHGTAVQIGLEFTGINIHVHISKHGTYFSQHSLMVAATDTNLGRMLGFFLPAGPRHVKQTLFFKILDVRAGC